MGLEVDAYKKRFRLFSYSTIPYSLFTRCPGNLRIRLGKLAERNPTRGVDEETGACGPLSPFCLGGNVIFFLFFWLIAHGREQIGFVKENAVRIEY